MATFADLEARIPEIRRYYREWFELRRDTGEDPTDYQAFRQHVIFRDAPDPGEEPIEDFLTPDGQPIGNYMVRPRGLAGAAARPEDADATLKARPLSNAEAGQLGPTSEDVSVPAGSAQAVVRLSGDDSARRTDDVSGAPAAVLPDGRHPPGATAPASFVGAPVARPAANAPPLERFHEQPAGRARRAADDRRARYAVFTLLAIAGLAAVWWFVNRRRVRELVGTLA